MNSSLSVLHVSSEKSWRGGEQQIAYLLEELGSRGLKNWVAVRRGSAFEAYCLQKGIPHHSLPFCNGMDLWTAWKIRQIARNHSIDLLHLHTAKAHSLAIWAAVLGLRTPLILSRRVDVRPSSSWLTRFKYNHPQIRKILCVSEKIAEIMRSFVNDPSKVAVAYSGVALPESRPQKSDRLRVEFGIPTDATLIGNTSALVAHKDYATFIGVIEALIQKGRNVYGVILGEGPLREPLKELVSSKRLGSRIHFAGFRPQVQSLLPDLDVFLMTSQEEGLGTSVLDAFAAGVAVVATRAGGIPEMVMDRETGLLRSIQDVPALASAVDELISDSALRQRLVTAAGEKVKQFSKARTAETTLRYYRETLGRTK